MTDFLVVFCLHHQFLIKYNQNLAKFEKISDIIDISGSLETRKKKDVKKINIFLKNINKVNKKNEN